MDELSFNREQLQQEFTQLYSGLNVNQKNVLHEIIDIVVSRYKGGVFFVYGHGGTWKTYLWRTLCAAIRRVGKIVLPVASSGIASLPLPRGKTVDLGIPLNINENSTCVGRY